MSLDVKALILNGRRAEVLKALFSTEGKVLTFGSFLDQVQEEASFVSAFNSLTVQDLFDYGASLVPAGGTKAPKVTVDVPAIENFKDEAVQAAWIAKVVALLTTVGVGEGRGISPQAIRVAIGSGNESQGRELMGRMEAAGTIHATSKARGKKYVLAAHKAAAEQAWAKEQADAKTEADEKAKAAAEKAKAAPATPVDAKAAAKKPAAK